jgi:hypothetical protein
MTETSRITMIWPTETKAKVQENAGQRGMTEWVLDAVDRKLRDLEENLGEPVSTPLTEKILEAIDPEATFEEDPHKKALGIEFAEDEAQAMTHAQMTDVGAEHFGEGAPTLADISKTYGLVPASEIVPPTIALCATCQAPLVDGECLACAF